MRTRLKTHPLFSPWLLDNSLDFDERSSLFCSTGPHAIAMLQVVI